MQDSLWRLRVLKSFPVSLDQLCQPLVALGNLEADLGLRIVLGQQSGSLPPCLSALAVNSGVPIFWHAFAFLQPDGRFDVLECMTGDEARARAAHYRQLARQMTDGVARDELFKLAAEYDALVERLSGPVGTGRVYRARFFGHKVEFKRRR
jgi:hypothetical protein